MASAHPDAVPRLGDAVVTLRGLEEHDEACVVEQSRDPETVRWTTVPPDYQASDAQDYLEKVRADWASGAREQWAVEAEGRFVGLVSLIPQGADAVEVAFAAHPATRGHGYLTRAVGLVCDRAFAQGRQLVLWHAQVGNVASRRVAWRTGFTITEPQQAMMGGTLRNVWSGTLTADDPREPRTPWLGTPVLTSDDVRLRPFRDDDEDALPAERDAPLQRWMGHGSPTRDTYAAWLVARRTRAATGAGLMWAVVDPATDALLGGIQLQQLGIPTRPRSGMLGYWLLPPARGRRVMDRALDLVVHHAFAGVDNGGLGLQRLSAGADVDNLPSLAILRRAGFREVGTERRAMIAGDDAVDELLLDLLASDDRATQRVEPDGVPVFETERLRLRPWRDDDVPEPDEGPDAASLRFIPTGAHPGAAAFAEWLRSRRHRMAAGGDLNWCVADRATDHALGNVTIFRMGHREGRFDGEVGYWLHPPARGRGYLPEALGPVVDHAFTPVEEGGLGLSRLHAGTDLDNLASQGVLEQAGFQQWGADRQAYRRSDGTLTDGAYFELLATDERVDQRARRRPGVVEVTLEGTRVRLRPLKDTDAPRIAQACSDDRAQHWLAGLPRDYSATHALQYVARCHGHAATRGGLYFAVADPDDDRLLACVALMGLSGETPGQAEVGYWSHPDAQGRGLMTEAVGMSVRHAFAPEEDGGLGLRRLVLRAAAGNTASQHVAEGNGFVRTGVQRSAENLGDGTWDDLVDYDLLADDWPATHEPDEIQQAAQTGKVTGADGGGVEAEQPGMARQLRS
ncbi:MAG: GNAT family N-acetyltransferase [Lapillicoccus sp.]